MRAPITRRIRPSQEFARTRLGEDLENPVYMRISRHDIRGVAHAIIKKFQDRGEWLVLAAYPKSDITVILGGYGYDTCGDIDNLGRLYYRLGVADCVLLAHDVLSNPEIEYDNAPDPAYEMVRGICRQLGIQVV